MDVIELNDKFEAAYETYDELTETSLPLIELDGVTLKEALKNQMPLMIKWEVMSKTFDHLFNEAEILVDEAYGNAIGNAYRAEKYREISTTEAKERAKGDATYKTAKRLMNKIRHSRDECKGILEVINSRKYTLNNLTNSIVAGVDRTIL